ncbi:MAG: hypothetical protein ACP5ER_02635 [Candidatus Bathyarchaeales archaeon]
MSEKGYEKLIVNIDGKNLALTPFVQRIIRKAVLAMLSTLRDAEFQGDETVEINVKRAAV